MQNTSTTCTTLRAIVMGDNKRMFYVGVVEGERGKYIGRVADKKYKDTE